MSDEAQGNGQVVVTEDRGDGVRLVRINRPEVRNALNMATRLALADAFGTFASDKNVRAIVLTGDEKAFAAGADLKESVDASPSEIMLRNTHLLWRTIEDCPKPIIAAVNGYALGGGCELAMHADIIIAGEGARFGQPEIRVGIMPGAGGVARLTRLVGKFKAMRMLLTGAQVTAVEAESMGLVSEVVPDDRVLDHALEMAQTIAAMPPIAAQQIKEVMIASQDASLEAGLALERKAYQLLFDTKDKQEGMAAFFEKRKPEFKGE